MQSYIQTYDRLRTSEPLIALGPQHNWEGGGGVGLNFCICSTSPWVFSKKIPAHLLFPLGHELQQLLQQVGMSQVIEQQQVGPDERQVLKAILQFNGLQQVVQSVEGGRPQVWRHSLVHLEQEVGEMCNHSAMKGSGTHTVPRCVTTTC